MGPCKTESSILLEQTKGGKEELSEQTDYILKSLLL